MFPCGALYYRPPNPPPEEWEEDLRTMVGLGFTVVKVVALWSWIDRGDGGWDFSEIDRLLEIACATGLKVILVPAVDDAPPWLIRRHSEALCNRSLEEGMPPKSRWEPTPCPENDAVGARAGEFLRTLSSRYADNPALWGYELCNDASSRSSICDATADGFIEWVKRRYGSLERLSLAWGRRYGDWKEVEPPHIHGPSVAGLDRLIFLQENRCDRIRRQADLLRSADSEHPIGVQIEASLSLPADIVEISEVDYIGLSAFPLRDNLHVGDYFLSLDLYRSLGKIFWVSSLQGGQSADGLSRSHHVASEDIRLWSWAALMCGAKGLVYRQWRPVTAGPEATGYGLCRPDGTPSDRAETAGWFAGFMGAHPELLEAAPVRGEVGIAMLPESMLYACASDRDGDAWYKAACGLYRALWNVNVQVDFCAIDDIGGYSLVYLPFPLMLGRAHAEKLKIYVGSGGVLVSDAAPGLLDEYGRASARIPGLGLDELFGAVEDRLEYVPVLMLGDISAPAIEWEGMRVGCSLYRESLSVSGGTPIARFVDGSAAVVDNDFGRGKARLIGTFPGSAFVETLDHEPELLIRDALRYAGVSPRIQPTDTFIKARLHRGSFGDFLWVLNTSCDSLTSEVTLLPGLGRYISAENVFTGEALDIEESALTITLGGFQGAVLRLR